MSAQADIADPSMEGELTITRRFDAPRELMFEMWTNPEHLAKWWGPAGFTNPVCEVDPKPGGAIRIVMRASCGDEYPMLGVFQEVVRPERLVFTNSAIDREGKPQLEGITTVTFAQKDGGTLMTMHTRVTGLVPEAAAMLKGMDAGWSQSIDRLQALLASG